jgi:hypothetical protein
MFAALDVDDSGVITVRRCVVWRALSNRRGVAADTVCLCMCAPACPQVKEFLQLPVVVRVKFEPDRLTTSRTLSSLSHRIIETRAFRFFRFVVIVGSVLPSLFWSNGANNEYEACIHAHGAHHCRGSSVAVMDAITLVFMLLSVVEIAIRIFAHDDDASDETWLQCVAVSRACLASRPRCSY